MQRGSDRVSAHKDDELKHELDGLLRSGHPTRAEEWHDPNPEPAADDDPTASFGPLPARGSRGEYEAMRFEIARHLARTAFPAKRAVLVRTLHERHAPDRVVALVESLPPDRTFHTVEDVASHVRIPEY
ncbi:DUF2795 domain-containing protein [Streptomyces sp. P1-3]|uniref:DUF2795 domain-containing protein n=1 Tax=Streptomyces sp. P1-3 TaxID=3421658 RepID=UPI003D363BC3